ncbi:hypothetical protein [Paraburkholderia sp. J8-2]|uniref:hypothetical protein n=1 Tax=Paraburkholderia sp. J8-2 TaxID=2805440 RepID=UPI002AB60716|nr:hypothetical protein [Paraburkholderia sp. J8-2]
MERFFRRFERVAFGMVTAVAVVCAGVLLVHRFGDALVPDVEPWHATSAGAPFALVCKEGSHAGSCEQLLTAWRDVQ